MNRAEWVKFLSLFFNKEQEANAIFDGIKANYEQIKVGGRGVRAGWGFCSSSMSVSRCVWV
jgi:hypothetical protein